MDQSSSSAMKNSQNAVHPIFRRKINSVKMSYTVKFCLDLLCIILVGLPVLLYYLIGKPYERGFYCNDESIRYPYKDSTITNNVLYIVGIFLPVTTMVIVETLHWMYRKPSTSNDKEITIFGWEVPQLLWRYYRKIGVFLFGACTSQLTTDIAKYSIGRLRPHFIDICKPVLTAAMCEDNKYVTEFQCLGTDAFRLKEARLSFPSGHSSFSAYAMLYVALYLQARMTWKCNSLLRPVLQLLVLYMAWFTGLSRVSDYKHHWSDVLVGMLQGTLVAILVVKYVSDLFTNKRHVRSEVTANETPVNYDTCTLQIEEKAHD